VWRVKTFDYVVIGSGCAGAMAAQTLVEAKANVVMLDVGVSNPKYHKTVPDKDFLSIRRTEKDQYKYFLGEEIEGVSAGEIGKASQVTPTRSHMTALTDKLLPMDSSTFSPLESLGYGGLGIGWGLQCWEYSDADMMRTGLDPANMSEAYEVVAGRIGISATRDAAAKYTIGKLKTFQPSAHMDRNHKLINKKYLAHEKRYRRRGLFVGRTPLALLTEPKDKRQAYKYRDMDFYDDNGRSAWRPWMTVDELRKKKNFTYIDSQLVVSFSEKDGQVTVTCVNTQTNETSHFQCHKLVLAASALGSARIVARSLGSPDTKLPLLSNPHSYLPSLQPAMLGKGVESDKLGFGQLSFFIDKVGDDAGLSVASTYSYQSLMLFRVMNQAPLAFRDSLPIMRYLIPGLLVVLAQHPDKQSDSKYLQLAKDPKSTTGDKLVAHYSLSEAEKKMCDEREKQYAKALRKLNIYTLKRMMLEHGASIHYAGTIPFSQQEKELTLSPSGRLHGCRNVYVADSSGFNFLPAKGLTFSLMANAHLIAENVLKNV
jgi:hypothetical protein